jgi:hypothetical protein
VTATFTAPQDATYCRLVLLNNGPQETVYFDDLFLAQIEPPVSPIE